jgi:hypothetical protein
MQSFNKLLGQEELGTISMRHERPKVRFTPYPSRSKKLNHKDAESESDSGSDSDSDLSSLSDSDDELISKPEGEAGRPGK